MISLASMDQDQSLRIPERPAGFPSRRGSESFPGGPTTPPAGFPSFPGRPTPPTFPTFPSGVGVSDLVGKQVVATTAAEETISAVLLSVQADYIALVETDGTLYLLSINKIQTISEL
jgi:hypothetical protein